MEYSKLLESRKRGQHYRYECQGRHREKGVTGVRDSEVALKGGRRHLEVEMATGREKISSIQRGGILAY